MRTIVRLIDSISEYTGKVICWACVVLVGVLTYEVIMRYAFSAPTIWSYELSRMLGATIVILGVAYTHRHHGHVRVDVFYTHFPPKWRTIIDIVFALLLFFPLFITLTYAAASEMWYSWASGEVLTGTVWYPPAGPIRTVMFLGLFLLALQGVAQFIRDLHLLIRNKPL